METLLARQPVFDRDEHLFGYDIFVGASDPSVAVGPDDLFAAAVLGNTMDRVVGEEASPAFLAVDRGMLESPACRLLAPGRIIPQLTGPQAEDESVATTCAELRRRGYQIALASGDPLRIPDAVLRNADIGKVDVTAFDRDDLAVIASRFRDFRVHPLAMNIPHRGGLEQCIEMGFTLFEGYRFSVPETLVPRDLPASDANTLGVLRLVRDHRSSDADVEEAIGRDVSLSYKLLRMVNSASVGGREIWSIGHALRVLGREQVGRWLGLLLVTDGTRTGVHAELMRLALVRARLAELLATASGVPRAGSSLFLVGLLSPLDQLFETPMETLVTTMELGPDVRQALLYREDYYGAVLAMIEAFEVGVWDDVGAWAAGIGVSLEAVGSLYLDALDWAARQLREAQGRAAAPPARASAAGR